MIFLFQLLQQSTCSLTPVIPEVGRLISDSLGGSLENAEKQSRLPESKGQYQ